MKLRERCFAAVLMGAAMQLTLACASSDRPRNEEAETQTGTLGLPLETFGASGARYRLLNATFEVHDVRNGRLEEVLHSEDEPFSSVLTTELDAGNYTVSLQPGWFIERIIDGGGGSGGMAPSPFPTPTPTAFPAPFPPSPAVPPPIDDEPGVAGSDDSGDSEETDDETSFEPEPGPSPGGFGERVNAALQSDAIQFVSIFANQDSFAFYTFLVGDDVVSFDPGRLNLVFEVIETDPPPPDPCTDPVAARRPAVIETNTQAVQFVSLRGAFDAMAANAGFMTDGETIYHQVIDSYATADEGQLPSAIHCGDEMTDGEPTLNGYPIRCNRQERFQFDNLDSWFPMAFINRIDLAPENGAHCGQQRMIFGNNVQGRMFFILEAQIPNPAPELGLAGCVPLAEFWAGMTQIDPFTRGLELSEAFLNGHPQLADAGFGAFFTATNFTVGSGQIRTNNFDDFVWTLREFKLGEDGADLKAIPFPVAESPNGPLWNDTLDQLQGPGCRDAFINQSLAGVLTDNPAQMSFVVPQECKNSESENNGSENYSFQMSEGDPNGFRAQLEAALDGTGLTPDDVANRAQFAGSCIGCHIEANGTPLGHDVFSPFSLGFVHVAEFTEQCEGNQSCFSTSSALKDVFLPHRLSVVQSLANVSLPPQCGEDPPPPVDGGVEPEPQPVMEPVVILPEPGQEEPAPPFEPVLPDADTATQELVEQDEEAREIFGSYTIGGQVAQQSH